MTRTPEHLAVLLRERVYGGITCLSTLLALAGQLDEPPTDYAVESRISCRRRREVQG